MSIERPLYYKLDEHHQVCPCDATAIRGAFENIDNRRVAVTQVGKAEVSTVFLCIDHNFRDAGPPLLFETMVFVDGEGEDNERWCARRGFERCSTWDEAVEQHERVVAALRKTEGETP